MLRVIIFTLIAVTVFILVKNGSGIMMFSSNNDPSDSTEYWNHKIDSLYGIQLKELSDADSIQESYLRQVENLISSNNNLIILDDEIAKLRKDINNLKFDALQLNQEIEIFQRDIDSTDSAQYVPVGNDF